jgi:hypothetical protein
MMMMMIHRITRVSCTHTRFLRHIQQAARYPQVPCFYTLLTF